MPIACEFLGAQRPALPAATDYLLARYVNGGAANLRRVIVGVPGSRAGRRLLEILVADSESRGLLLTPPQIETVGNLPEKLYRPKRPFASEFTQRLVWAETLRCTPAEQLAPIIRQPPEAHETDRWMALGDLLRRQHAELAGEGLSFGNVANLGQDTTGFVEAVRWRALHDVQQAYLRRLDALELWDRQTARLVAIQKHECATDCDIVLAGAVDMNVTLRRMLDQVASRVTALIFASPEWQDRFDAHGCLIPSRWTDVLLPIAAEQVVVVDGPAEQAAKVRDCVASFAGKYRADEIVIGVPDEQLIPHVQRTLATAAATARWGPGQPLVESRPVYLLRAVLALLASGRFADLAALARHADVGDWLAQQGTSADLLEQLDTYQSEHLPYRLDGKWLGPSKVLPATWQRIEDLLRPLGKSPRRLTDWSEPILELLDKIYGERQFDRTVESDRLVLAACEAIHDSLRGQSQVPEPIMPIVSAEKALSWLLDDLRHTAAPALADDNAIEMLGWLELPLDDAPALIVTSFNEGFVPQSVNSDLFLPNSLRQQLGMLDNDRRYARDAFAIALLAMSRERLQLIVARRNGDGDPLAPSRLLFAVDPETAARRALDFFRPPGEPRQRPILADETKETEGGLLVPRPRPLPTPISQLRVTSFRDYLACPYRFYLKHILQLDVLDDTARELDGRGFGNLAHEVLSRFGCSSGRDSTDATEIAEMLNHELNQCASNKYGPHPLPAVLVQIEQLRLRLRSFAEFQARWAQDGWHIEMTEGPATGLQTAEFSVDGQSFLLCGRIDRIDLHSATGARVIWDYKTSDSGERPEKTHRQGGQWIDLQLPLYRHLAKGLGIHGPAQLGYINLPKDTRRTQFCIAEWSEEQLAEADEVARDIIRRLRREEFWPPVRKPPAFSEIYAPICQDDVLDRAEWSTREDMNRRKRR